MELKNQRQINSNQPIWRREKKKTKFGKKRRETLGDLKNNYKRSNMELVNWCPRRKGRGRGERTRQRTEPRGARRSGRAVMRGSARPLPANQCGPAWCCPGPSRMTPPTKCGRHRRSPLPRGPGRGWGGHVRRRHPAPPCPSAVTEQASVTNTRATQTRALAPSRCRAGKEGSEAGGREPQLLPVSATR